MDVKCNHCQKWKDETEFNWRYKALGIRHSTCREYQKPFRKNWYEGDAHERHLKNVKERQHEAREVARDYVYRYLETHPCVSCGEKIHVFWNFITGTEKIWPLLLWYQAATR